MTDGRVTGSIGIGPYGPAGKSVLARVDRDLAKIVNHLIHLGYDLVGAYSFAIDRVKNPDLAQSLQVLSDAHAHRIDQLSEAMLSTLDAEPTHRPDIRVLLEKARVALGERKGDRGILAAMATNESSLAEAYREALAHGGMPDEIRAILEQTVGEEDRHRDFYAKLLEGPSD